MPYVCDSGDGNPAAMLVTNLTEGEVIALCGDCLPQWVLLMADGLGLITEPATLPGDVAGTDVEPEPADTPDTPAPVKPKIKGKPPAQPSPPAALAGAPDADTPPF